MRWQLLCSLKQPSYLKLNYTELLAQCESISLDITKTMADKQQDHKAAISYPFVTLRHSVLFTNATKWGCKHEKEACEMYLIASRQKHDFSVEEVAL